MHEPSIREKAFSCPHCGTYTTQYWHDGYVKYIQEEPKIPYLPHPDFEKEVMLQKEWEPHVKERLINEGEKLRAKIMFTSGNSNREDVLFLNNLFLSECYNCKKWAVRVNEDLVYPSTMLSKLSKRLVAVP